MGPMPENCDGIELINLNADFCKLNCRWIGPHNRRALAEMPGNQTRKGRRTLKEPTMICIRVEKEYADFLKRQAIEKSRQLGEVYSVSELIREIVEQQAPMPKQMNMFDEKDKK